MLYDDAIEKQQIIRAAVNRLEFDFRRLLHGAQERRNLCSQMTARIAPLLLEKGFIKKKNCFFRIHGDALLQIIGTQYSIGQFGVYSYIYPMYDILKTICDPLDDMHHLIGLHNNYPIEARQIEEIAGIHDNSLLEWQTDFDLPMNAEYQILEKFIIPILDTCCHGTDAMHYNNDSRTRDLNRNRVYSISYLLRDGQYHDCIIVLEKLGRQFEQTLMESIERVLSDELLRSMTAEQIAAWETEKGTVVNYYQRMLTIIRKMIESIKANDETFIHAVMNEAAISAHKYLTTINKKVDDLYPIENLLL